LGLRSIARRHALVAIAYSQERSELRPSKRSQPAPGAQQRVLQGILGVVDRAEHPVAVRAEPAAVRADELAEGGLVAGARGGEQVLLAHPLTPFCCQKAISPPAGVETTLRQPAGPSRGSTRTVAPSSVARAVAWSTRPTST
jgi:hypothetical protein